MNKIYFTIIFILYGFSICFAQGQADKDFVIKDSLLVDKIAPDDSSHVDFSINKPQFNDSEFQTASDLSDTADVVRANAADSVRVMERLGVNSTDSLLSFLPFDDGTGKDIWGGLDADMSNADFITEPDSAYRGGAFSFNGTDEYGIWDDLLNDAGDDEQGTVGISVNLVDATPSVRSYLWAFGDTDGLSTLSLDVQTDGTLRALAYFGATVYWSLETDNAVLIANKYSQIVVSHNGTQATIYVDGIEVAQTFSNSDSLHYWFADRPQLDNGRIFCRNINSNGNTEFLNGRADEAAYYSRALSAAEVRRQYAQYTGGTDVAVADIDSVHGRVGEFTETINAAGIISTDSYMLADSFVTRSEKAMSDNAVERITQIKSLPGTEKNNYALIDHSTVPVEMQVVIDEKFYKDKKTGAEYHRRDIKNVVLRELEAVEVGVATDTDTTTVTKWREIDTGELFNSPDEYQSKKYKQITKKVIGLNLSRYIFEVGRAVELLEERLKKLER